MVWFGVPVARIQLRILVDFCDMGYGSIYGGEIADINEGLRVDALRYIRVAIIDGNTTCNQGVNYFFRCIARMDIVFKSHHKLVLAYEINLVLPPFPDSFHVVQTDTRTIHSFVPLQFLHKSGAEINFMSANKCTKTCMFSVFPC